MKKIVKNVWIAGGGGAKDRANTIYERLFWAAAQEETALLARYGTAATGLTPEQVERSREEHGSNVLTDGKPWPARGRKIAPRSLSSPPWCCSLGGCALSRRPAAATWRTSCWGWLCWGIWRW